MKRKRSWSSQHCSSAAWNRGSSGSREGPRCHGVRGPAERRHTLAVYRARRPSRSPPCFISSGKHSTAGETVVAGGRRKCGRSLSAAIYKSLFIKSWTSPDGINSVGACCVQDALERHSLKAIGSIKESKLVRERQKNFCAKHCVPP